MGLRKKIKKFIYRNKFKDFDLKKENFQNQNILITGANSGIGLELVKKFIDLKKIFIYQLYFLYNYWFIHIHLYKKCSA